MIVVISYALDKHHIPNLLHFYSVTSYKACLKQGVVHVKIKYLGNKKSHVNTCNKFVTYVKFSFPLFCKKKKTNLFLM